MGSTTNDGTGDPLRSSFDKTNDNFNEIYSSFGNGSTLSGVGLTVGVATYANVAGIATHAQGIIGAPDLNVGIVTANGFISATGVTPVTITHTGTTLTLSVAGVGSTQLPLT